MDENEPRATPPADVPGAGEGTSPVGQKAWLRFALLFGAFAITSEVLYLVVALESKAFTSYLEVLAMISGHVLNFFGTSVAVSGTQIAGGDFAVQVAQGCDAIQVCSLLAAAVIAFPLGWAAKLRGLVAGVGLLQLLNILRIVSLYWIGKHFPDIFTTTHEVAWPMVLIAVTIGSWILWVRFETEYEAAVPNAA